jgi:hypothetical protein
LHFNAAIESQKAKRHDQDSSCRKYSHFALMPMLELEGAKEDNVTRYNIFAAC